MDGHSSLRPCAIIACGKHKNNVVETTFGYVVCEDHQHLTSVQISNCANDPWARMKLLGDYPGCPPKYQHLGGDVE